MSGMQARFDGAAAGLKNNLDGARDRVKAAMRDIGALISAPVIDPTGGGWGVTLTNTYADILRSVQTAITPMVNELAARLAPSVLVLDSNLQKLASTIRQVDMTDLRSTFALIEPYLPTIAGGLAAISTQGLAAVPVIGGLVGGLQPLAVGLAAAAAASPEVRAGLADILAAGKPLVPVVGEVATILSGMFASGLSVAGELLSAVSPLVSLLADGISAIPAPMLAAATAITLGSVALRAFSQSAQVKGITELAGHLPKLGSAFDSMRLTAMYAGDAMRTARVNGAGPLSTALAGLSPIATGATSAIGKVGTALKTAFLANPVGAIVLGVSTAIAAFSMASADAEQKTAEWNSEMETLRGTLDQTSAAITEQTESQIVQNFQAGEWATRVTELNGGLWTLADMTMAVTGESSKLTDELTSLVAGQANWTVKVHDSSGALTTYGDRLSAMGISQSEMVEAIAKGGDTLDDVKTRFTDAGGSVEDFDSMVNRLGSSMNGINMDALKAIYEESEKLDAAKAVLEQYNDEMKRLREEGGEAAVEQRRLADAIDTASNSANDASERIRALREALDILNGGTLTAAEQQQKLDDAIRDMGDAFDQAKDDAGNFNSALIDAQGNIDTSTEQGSTFRDNLMGISDEMFLAAQAAAQLASDMGEDPYTASLEAMKPYVAELESLAAEYGLTDEQVQGLLESLGMMPEEAALFLNVTGLDETEQGLAQIAGQLLGLEEGEHQMFVQADTDEAKQRLEELGFYVTETSDGRWRIDLSADPDEAQEQIDALIDYVTGSDPTATIHAQSAPAEEEVAAWKAATDATVAISTADADAAEARGEVLAWKLEADGTWSVSHMDAEKAEADSTVITWKRDADGTWGISNLGADTVSAYTGLNGFVSDANSTWATVNISADTSSANAAIQRMGGQSISVSVYPQMMYADGGIMAYANGGMLDRARLGIQAFADGGTPHATLPTGIYPGGRPILKFAEPETGWEAFVSGKRGMERRNLGILADAQDRLLKQLGLANVRKFADGGTVASDPVQRATASAQNHFHAPLVHIDQAVMDTPERVDELASKLWRLADQNSRSQGRVNLGGPTT
jgi:methyl-accepting chemotaxis protein